MSVLSPAWIPSAEGLRRGGTVALLAALVLSVAGVLGLVWAAPDMLPLVPVLVVGVGVAAFLVGRPDLHLYAVLLASATVLHHESGVQITEVVYGVYVILFIALWMVRDVAGPRTLLESTETKTLLLFGVYVTALLPVAFVYGGTAHTVVREATSLVMLAFLFPIREVCSRSERGVRAIVTVGLVLSLFVIVRNLLMYQQALNDARQLSELVTGRVIVNDHVLAASALVSFVFLLHANRAGPIVRTAIVFMLSVGGLLLTMSRGFWIATVWGLMFIFVVVDRRNRARIALYGSMSIAPLLAIGVIFFGDLVYVYFENLVDRLFSVQDSFTTDISMLGRVYEAKAALGHIALNPVLGHGPGVPFTFSTILTRTQLTQTFVHNGYVYLWYAFGLVGGGVMLVLWARAIQAGVQAYRTHAAPEIVRLAGLAAAAALFAFTLSAMTSNPFWHKDYLLGFGFLMGIAYGTRAQAVRRPAGHSSPLAPAEALETPHAT